MKLIKAQKLLDELKPKEAWEYLRINCFDRTPEYYHLAMNILTALGYYKDARQMYFEGMKKCKTNEQLIEYKSLTHHDFIMLERVSSLVHEIKTEYLYSVDGQYVFMDIDTYETYTADEEAVKYVRHHLIESNHYVMILDAFDKPINVAEDNESDINLPKSECVA